MFRNSTAKCKGIGILQSFVFAEGVVINTPGKERSLQYCTLSFSFELAKLILVDNIP